jgi:hypothetical protein
MRSKNHGKPTKNDGTSPFLVGKIHYKLPCSIANCEITRGYVV